MKQKKYLVIMVMVVAFSFAGTSLSFGLTGFTKAAYAQSGTTETPQPGPQGPVCPIE